MEHTVCRKYLSYRAAACVISLLLGIGATTAGFAFDGVIEINHERALAGGITPTDAPGYPVTLDRAGSYRLTSNLAPSGSPKTVIGILAEGVTIDLNGFAITGANTGGTGTSGIRAASGQGDSVVKNGVVTDMSGTWAILLDSNSRVSGVRVVGNARVGINCNFSCAVTQCHVIDNGGDGISVNHNGIITSNHVIGNQGSGIDAEIPALISGNEVRGNLGTGIATLGGRIADNVVLGNGIDGINADRPQPGISTAPATITGNYVSDSRGGDGIRAGTGSTVLFNTVERSAGFGITMGTAAGYGNNVVTGNAAGQVSGGIEIGTNVCGSDTVCP